jgi:hypothetical protein
MQPLSPNSKIFTHPDKNEISERLLAGESTKSVEKWLRQKYPHHSRKWVSYLTLQTYRTFNLNLRGEVLKEIKQQNRALTTQRINEKSEVDLKNKSEYIEAKNRIAANILDFNQEILKIHDKVWERIHIMEQQAVKHQNDRVITDLLSQARGLLVDYSNMLKKQEDHKSGGNTINIQLQQQVDQRLGAMKRAIQKTLKEVAPELIPTFLDNLRMELETIKDENGLAGNTGGTSVNIQVNQ